MQYAQPCLHCAKPGVALHGDMATIAPSPPGLTLPAGPCLASARSSISCSRVGTPSTGSNSQAAAGSMGTQTFPVFG